MQRKAYLREEIIMNRKVCQGCGILLQDENVLQEGYTTNLENDICQRCFRMKNYGEYQSVAKTNEEYMKILHLCFDGNFIEHSMSVFDQFYPEKNFWIILELKGKKRIIKREGPNIIRTLFEESDNFLHTVSVLNYKEKFDKIVCHGFHKLYTEVIKSILAVLGV